jgi:hypothetical protein
MSPAIAVQEQFSRHPIGFQSTIAALCRTWTTRALKHAIADVASMSDQDYHDFGLDKGDILRGLGLLRYELECSSLRSPAHFSSSDHQKPPDTKLFDASTREPLVIARVSSGL